MVSNGKRKEACPNKGPCMLNVHVSDSSLRTDRMQLHVHVHVPVTAIRQLRAKPGFTIIKTN